ncbi:SGNH/GDSL hydrolase family protein [Blastopirellula marina]|nr:SGNH/GDSL hydrolase family protein [Blastopirellula marina]
MRILVTCFLLFGLWNVAAAQQPILKKGDRLAIIGDSITEQKQYSKFMETYLLACHPELDIKCFQFGWGGERAPGFANRMENDLIPWHPDVITTCYGMNDGSYRAYDDNIGKVYEKGMRDIIDRMKKEGVTVVVGSPGVVDSFTWARDRADFDQVYNANLKKLGEIAKSLADENHFSHADVFGEMYDSMVAAKAKLGEEYPVAGGDGVHPSANGHLIMAYAFLKALGVSGDIGTITINIGGDPAATAGHKIIGSSKGGSVEIESTRYPFCFTGNDKDPNGTVSILPFTPFNEDLNRFTLKVNNLSAPEAEVTFGDQTKTFTKQQLSEGINLAAEFLNNPFSKPFDNVMNQVARKQAFETTMIKGLITNFRQFQGPLGDDPEVQSAMNVLRDKMFEVDDKAYDNAKGAVVPVRYQISVKPKS